MVESVAARMLRSAGVDVAACKALDSAPGMVDTVIGFHAQQACEKCLKAVLATVGADVPRTHDLLRLMELLDAQGSAVPASAQWIDALNPYAVEARYGMVEPGKLDRQRTLASVDEMLAWAMMKVSSTEAR
jgi:HEPN domain-containing protein